MLALWTLVLGAFNAFWTFATSKIGRWIVGAAVVALVILGAFWKGDHHGYASCKADWVAAEKAAADKARAARDAGDRDAATPGVRDPLQLD